jgi:hypothetical protein
MNRYQHLTADQRHYITAMRRLHCSLAELPRRCHDCQAQSVANSGAMSPVTIDGIELRKHMAMRLHEDRASIVGHGLALTSGFRSRLCYNASGAASRSATRLRSRASAASATKRSTGRSLKTRELAVISIGSCGLYQRTAGSATTARIPGEC